MCTGRMNLRYNEAICAVHVMQYPSPWRTNVTATAPEEIRRRLVDRLASKRMDAKGLAKLVGRQPRTVQNYVKAKGPHAIPAEFIALCEAKGFAAARWLLLGEGAPDVAGPDQIGRRLVVVGRIIAGDFDDAFVAPLANATTEELASLAGADVAALLGLETRKPPRAAKPATSK